MSLMVEDIMWLIWLVVIVMGIFTIELWRGE